MSNIAYRFRSPEDSVDLDAYLRRIGHRAPVRVDVETLRALHRAHVTSIVYENVDILLRREVRIDVGSLQAKMVTGGRGGYCYEHNLLFAAMLETAGFHVRALTGRVRFGAREGIRPRSHLLLRVQVGGEAYLADVGYGGFGLLEPIAEASREPVVQSGWRYRLRGTGSDRVLQGWYEGGWTDFYEVGLDEVLPVDCKVLHHFSSTHPTSPFLRRLLVNGTNGDVRWKLQDRTLMELRPDAVTVRDIDEDNLLQVLADVFGLHFPSGTRIPRPG